MCIRDRCYILLLPTVTTAEYLALNVTTTRCTQRLSSWSHMLLQPSVNYTWVLSASCLLLPAVTMAEYIVLHVATARCTQRQSSYWYMLRLPVLTMGEFRSAPCTYNQMYTICNSLVYMLLLGGALNGWVLSATCWRWYTDVFFLSHVGTTSCTLGQSP